MKAVVFTLGCKVNECESDGIISALLNAGYEVSDRLICADLYIVNTCAVTAEAEKKSRQMASRIKKLNANAKIIFTGCATQKSPQSFVDKAENCLVTGVFKKGEIINLINEKGLHIFEENKEYEEMPFVKSLRTRTYIKVQDGCNNFCSYCIIPYLRGRSRSRNPESVLKEIVSLKPQEAIINGINLSSYNFNGKNLRDLMEYIKGVDCRIRLGSLEVNVIDKEFLQTLTKFKNFARHFHLSLQSGSDDVLKKMNRKYSANEFIEKVNLIREYFPNAGITTDIIVGFPSETEQDFINTLNLCDKVEFSDIHVFVFSPRKGTKAYEMIDLSMAVKKQREKQLLEKKEFYKSKFIASQLNKIVNVIIEDKKDGYFRGYSENYIKVYLPCESIKNIQSDRQIKVKLTMPFLDGAMAQII